LYLRSHGIDTLIHYPVALPQQTAFAAFSPADCPTAGRAAAEVLSLPLYPTLDASDITRVADAARAFQKGRVLA
jgi:dTDP-4-amino-4,6-dideoxygalactose transaminase